MPINQNQVYFPGAIVDLLVSELQTIDPSTEDPPYEGIRVVRRPIRITDYTRTVSVIPALWTPDNDSLEMQGGIHEPTLQRYTIAIETLVIDADEERGLNLHSLLAALVRQKLYRSSALRAALPMLAIPMNGYMEKLSRWGVANQYFQGDRVNNGFTFLGTLETWFETETHKL